MTPYSLNTFTIAIVYPPKAKKHGGKTYVSLRAYIFAIIRAGGVNSLWNFKLEKVGEFMRFRLHQGFPYVQIAIFFQMGKAILP